MVKIGVLISGSGSNLQEIIDACNEKRINAEVAVVISNRQNAYGLERALKSSIPAVYIDPKKEDFNKKVIEILPKYGGAGMYGVHVHDAVIKAKEKVSGCTVHIVDEEYDKGTIILQKKVKVLKSDTPEILQKRVLEQEHIAYPEAIKIVIKMLFEKTKNH